LFLVHHSTSVPSAALSSFLNLMLFLFADGIKTLVYLNYWR